MPVRESPPNTRLLIDGRIDRTFFRRAARQLETMLRDTKSSVLLQIGGFDVRELRVLKGMLNRLVQYHDRITIAADETSRSVIKIDSSVSTLALTPIPPSTPPAHKSND